MASGRVYVLTPDFDFAIGGVKVHYQVVDALNRAGVDATVVHEKRGFRCTWFDNATKVQCVENVRVSPEDLIVVPEEWAHFIPGMPEGVPKVVFNQNAYSTFSWGPDAALVGHLYGRPDVHRVVVVSDDNRRYLEYALPQVRISRLRVAIDSKRFHDRDPKTRSIAYMPRKRRQEALDVLALLHLRGALTGWEVVPIDGASEEKTAELLRRASLFLSFSHREGLGLPPAEAMASGCVVVGFHGFGGRDFGDHGLWVPDGDVRAFAEQVEEVLRGWPAHEGAYRARGRAASAFVHEHFSVTNQDVDVLSGFGDWRPGPGRGAVPMPTTCWTAGRPPPWRRAIRRLAKVARHALQGSRT